MIGILAIVLGVWTGAEVMWYGMDGAFGGLFVRLGLTEALHRSDGDRIEAQTVPMGAASRYRGAYAVGIDRVEEQLERNQ